MSDSPSRPEDLDRDQRLMLRVGGGDREAFALLYDRFAPQVMTFLYGLCQERAVAEDLTQDTFLAVWSAAARWRPRGKVRTWVFQIAKRRWWKRSARRRMRREREPLATAGRPAEDPALPGERTDEVERLHAAIRALSPKLREVFVLVRLIELPYAETAEVTGLRLGTVKSRMAAAEAQLRRALDPTHAGGVTERRRDEREP